MFVDVVIKVLNFIVSVIRVELPKIILHLLPVFSISACDTLVTLVTSKCHKGLGAVWLCVTRDNFQK